MVSIDSLTQDDKSFLLSAVAFLGFSKMSLPFDCGGSPCQAGSKDD